MSDSGAPPRSARRLGKWWIELMLARHHAVLLVAFVITLAAGWRASKLHIDSDLRTLLPPEDPVVIATHEVEGTFGAVGSINVVVKGGTVDARHALADALDARLEQEPLIRDVDHRLEADFVTEHALYYLSDEEMEELRERIQAWQHYELCSAAPDVCSLDPDPQAAKKLERFMNKKRTEAEDRAGFRDYYEREGVEALVLFAMPTKPSSDLAFSEEVVARSRVVVDEVARSEGPWKGAGIETNIVGPYVIKADERVAVQRDMVRSGLAGLLGVISVLYILFRSWRAVFTLSVPLICGLAWSLGLAELTLGRLNTMTSVISSVVMGMGIDAGIHLLSRMRREREEHENEDAIRRAFEALILPLLIASSTTVGAFMVMASSDFPAFAEFGAIAAYGVASCLLSMLTVYPALLRLVGIKRAKKSPSAEPGHFVRGLLRRPGAVFLTLALLTVASTQGVRRVEFERQGRTLQSDSTRALVEEDTFLISEILGRDVHAGILLVDDYEEVEALYARAQKAHARRQEMGETRVGDLFAAPRLLPPSELDLEERREAIEFLTEDFTDRTWARLEGRDPDADDFEPADPASAEGSEDSAPSKVQGLSPEEAKALRKMLDAKPFTVEDLPPQILRRIRSESGGKDGKGVWGIFAYPNYDPADILTCVEFIEETTSYAFGKGIFVGEPSIYATMYLAMSAEWPVMLGMASLLVIALVFWQVRSFGATLMTLLPLAVSLWWLMGFMGFSDLRFTLFNIPILPAILGIGVDNGVYLTAGILAARARGEKGGLGRSVDETSRAIAAATATTAAGFGAFLTAGSGGLRSIGALAVAGIIMAALAALLVLPTLSALVERRRGGDPS